MNGTQVLVRLGTGTGAEVGWCVKDYDGSPLLVPIFEALLSIAMVLVPGCALAYTYSRIYFELKRVVLAPLAQGVLSQRRKIVLLTVKFENSKNNVEKRGKEFQQTTTVLEGSAYSKLHSYCSLCWFWPDVTRKSKSVSQLVFV